jgi:hypothetical protein
MARLKRKGGKLTAADLASFGILPKQPDASKLVKSQESETLDGAAAVSEPSPQSSDSENGRLTTRYYDRLTKPFIQVTCVALRFIIRAAFSAVVNIVRHGKKRCEVVRGLR